MDNVVQCAVRVIEKASREKPADAVLREELRNSKLSRADSPRVAELVFGYYRWRRWLTPEDGKSEIGDRAKTAAAIDQARDLDERFRREPNSFTDTELAQAVPEWASDEVPLTPALLRALQSPPSIWLRARKGQGRALAKRLGPARAGDVPANAPAGGIDFSDCIRYFGHDDLYRMPEFQDGEFEIQDIASQMVGLLCAPKPGETWWDACAGEGGKTLHLSDLMGNKGLIWATDRAEWRLKKLKQRAARASAFNYRAVPWDGSAKLPTKTKFDGVLVDAPCSGAGTWQRNPHARWTTTREDVLELAEIQKRLVLHAAAAVKPGGKLIYSVCTLTRSETDVVAESCSQALSGFAPLALPALPTKPGAKAGWIWPQDFGGNGMFVCAWQRV